MRSFIVTTVCLLVTLLIGCNHSSSDQNSHNTLRQDSSITPETFGPEPWPPTYQGGGDSIFHFITQNIVYPESALQDEVEGVVQVDLWVDVDGSTRDFKIARGIRMDLDSAALTVVKQLPAKWKAGTMNGKSTPMQVTIPVHFRLD